MLSWSVELSEYHISYEGRATIKGQMDLQIPKEVTLEMAVKFQFQASNNQVEYEALIAGLKLAKESKSKSWKSDPTLKLLPS
ncbi:hypothetical protein PIB30_010655, partial [Stylosanthes scabra]|nr:hypothetical protein [Stylosanthes scabra]